MNKQELISTLKDLDALDAEQKAYLINLVNTKKKYGLVWEDKPEDVEERLRQHLPVLTEVTERRIMASPGERNKGGKEVENPMNTSKAGQQAAIAFAETEADEATIPPSSLPSPDRRGAGDGPPRGEVEVPPDHILIEGDNLHALTALTFTHEGRVDVIYIDPPYNTKNKDFKYNDVYIDYEDSYRHSKWLSFMYKRLLIARRLLAETGVIFISIDDNEQAQLKLLCDEVFGEKNIVALFTWVRKKKGSNLSKEYRKITENLFCYKKSNSTIQLYGVKAYSEKQVPLLNRANNVNTLSFPENKIFVGKGINNGILKKKIYGQGELSVALDRDVLVENSTIVTPFKLTGRFRWAQDTVDDEILNGSEFYISKSFRINIRRHDQAEKFKSPSSLINPSDGIGTNEDATNELRSIFFEKDKLPFDYPKPVSLLSYIVNSVTVNNKNALILDFFAGSGTTLHATMQLNAEDGGTRQCILVTNNESNIAEEVCYERNRRVIQGYQNAKGQEVAGLTNNNLMYYRCETVPSARTEQNRRLLTRQSTELLKIKEGCYADITEASGFDPASCYVGTNERGKYTVVLYHNRRPQPLIAALCTFIQALPDRREKVRLYAFSEEKDALLADFQPVADAIEGVPLPEAIYNAYRATFRTLGLDKKPPRSPETEVDEAETDAEQPSLEFTSQSN